MRGKLSHIGFYVGKIGITPADAGKTSCSSCSSGTVKDHPRGCGENRLSRRLHQAGGGSPPRMRGKQYPPVGQCRRSGITPADAGKTQYRNNHALTHKDHPRGCGENVNRILGEFENIGSPPRMRGKLHDVESANYDERITPADAGKTGHERLAAFLNRDHPRGCGENLTETSTRRYTTGSPPRMRGKH